ncbi:MAG: CHAD domain-containing protein [Methylococcales bacterium]
MSLHFDLPANLTAEKLIAELSSRMPTQVAAKQYAIKTYYDSFDWRLYADSMIAEFNRSKSSSSFVLTDLEGRIKASADMSEVPAFIEQFQPGKLRELLQPALNIRALLAISTLDYENFLLNILNKDEKIVLRINIEKHTLCNSQALLIPIKGYDKPAEHVLELFDTLGLSPVKESILVNVLKLQGRKPKEYSSKLNINLAPDLRADIASKYIYSHLLKTIKANEQGTIDHIDSEFLHDFRVAVRRTRAGLSQIKEVFPGKISARYCEFFSWLGQITGKTRDLDVYLLNFAQYKHSLPVSIREDLNPLYDFLQKKQQQAQKQLAKKLRSNQYLSTLTEWEQFLNSPAPKNPTEANAHLAIKNLADRRILKVYKRVLAQGNAIDEHSAAETLHTLRKTCKKLRYLIEFFQNLYPEHQLRSILKNLKALQEVLGDFQDYEVQEQHLKLFSQEMLALGFPAETFLAMGVLIQIIDDRKTQTRKHFAASFTLFKTEPGQAVFSD